MLDDTIADGLQRRVRAADAYVAQAFGVNLGLHTSPRKACRQIDTLLGAAT